MLLKDYRCIVESTDRLPLHDLQPTLFGLYGEVGGLMATAKKTYREPDAYIGYKPAIEEELGDILWYFFALCRRMKCDGSQLLFEALGRVEGEMVTIATDLASHPIAISPTKPIARELSETLPPLGAATAELLTLSTEEKDARRKLVDFADSYIRTGHYILD